MLCFLSQSNERHLWFCVQWYSRGRNRYIPNYRSALVGVDLAGGRYRGTVVEDENTGEIELTFDMSVPAGMFLVQGTSPLDVTYSKHATVKTPASFGDGKPFEVYI